MAKKNSNKAGITSEFSARPLPKKEVSVEESIIEEPQEVSNIIPVEEPDDEYLEDEDSLLDVIKENGVVLSAIVSIIIVLVLSFLLCRDHSYSPEDPGDNAEVQVDNEFDSLTAVVKDYVQTISDPNKEQLCKQLYVVYVDASKSTQDVETTLKTIREKSREILGFDERVSRTNEAEWQKLFGSTGVIDNWLITANVEITESNKKAIFTAIAKGLN